MARRSANQQRKPPPKAPQVIVTGARAGSPLHYMLSVVNDETADPTRRDRLAISAAQYVHVRADLKGKKHQEAELADEAGEGSEWESDLQY